MGVVMTVLQFLLPHSQIAGQTALLKTYCRHNSDARGRRDMLSCEIQDVLQLTLTSRPEEMLFASA